MIPNIFKNNEKNHNLENVSKSQMCWVCYKLRIMLDTLESFLLYYAISLPIFISKGTEGPRQLKNGVLVGSQNSIIIKLDFKMRPNIWWYVNRLSLSFLIRILSWTRFVYLTRLLSSYTVVEKIFHPIKMAYSHTSSGQALASCFSRLERQGWKRSLCLVLSQSLT